MPPRSRSRKTCIFWGPAALPSKPARWAFTLIELLITVVIIAIVVAAALPFFEPNTSSILKQAGQVVVADLDYARNLAIDNGSKYTFTFSTSAGSYTLRHSGTDSSLNVLPTHPLLVSSDSGQAQVVVLSDLPGLTGTGISRVATVVGSTRTNTTTVEFLSQGQTTATNPTVIWLSLGSGSNTRYLPITIDATTGLATLGEITPASPLAMHDGHSALQLWCSIFLRKGPQC